MLLWKQQHQSAYCDKCHALGIMASSKLQGEPHKDLAVDCPGAPGTAISDTFYEADTNWINSHKLDTSK